MARKGRDLTISEYLMHMGKAVVEANLGSMKHAAELLGDDSLDSEVKIGDLVVPLDGTNIIPEGWYGLDKMEIECESAVAVARDKEGEPTGLALAMSRGLLRSNMNVRFKATFSRQGKVEALEILRHAGNEALRQELGKTPPHCKDIHQQEPEIEHG